MLQNFYEKESDIPKGLKAAYIAKNGRYELDELSETHPVVIAKNEIQGKHDTVKQQYREKANEVARLDAKGLPDGKVAVDPEIETLGNAANNAELTADEIPNLKTQSDELQKTIDSMKSDGIIRKALESNGMNVDKFFALKGETSIAVETVKEEKEGKTTDKYIVVSKDDQGVETKRDFDEFVKENDKFKPFYDDLKLSGEERKTWVTQESGDNGKTSEKSAAESYLGSRYKRPDIKEI